MEKLVPEMVVISKCELKFFKGDTDTKLSLNRKKLKFINHTQPGAVEDHNVSIVLNQSCLCVVIYVG